MTVLIVIVMFAIMLLIDHLLHRGKEVVAPKALATVQRAPRPLPVLVAGFEVRDNLRYHPGHTWALNESPELVRMGMDDFAARVVGKIERLSLPARGQWIRQGQSVIRIERDRKQAEMVSPIEGTVVDVNPRVIENPELAGKDPYGEGWLLKVNAPDLKTNLRNLLGGALARRWMDDAATRLKALLPAPAGVVAQDGGASVEDLGSLFPVEEWERMKREFFLT
jgi:glycine cleavage system H lipoate-binding protein